MRTVLNGIFISLLFWILVFACISAAFGQEHGEGEVTIAGFGFMTPDMDQDRVEVAIKCSQYYFEYIGSRDKSAVGILGEEFYVEMIGNVMYRDPRLGKTLCSDAAYGDESKRLLQLELRCFQNREFLGLGIRECVEIDQLEPLDPEVIRKLFRGTSE